MAGQLLAPDAEVRTLPHGTKVGIWRLKGCRGRGAYGTVYRAVREGDRDSGEAALKLAIHPRDARFKREAELLRRGHHPSVPQLLDFGEWRHPNGFIYPYVVMELGGSGPLPPRAVNPRVDTRLDTVIRRMLSLKPEERGTAKELAEALERGADQEAPELEEPLFEWETLELAEWSQEDLAAAEELGHRARRRKPRLLWLAAVVVGALVPWPRDKESMSTEENPTMAWGPPSEEQRDGSSSHVGDTTLMSAEAPMKTPSGRGVVEENLPKPLPEQLKPDAKGQCRQGLYAINGGCWMKVALEECRGDGLAYFIYKGTCYLPIFPRTRQPTSGPP